MCLELPVELVEVRPDDDVLPLHRGVGAGEEGDDVVRRHLAPRAPLHREAEPAPGLEGRERPLREDLPELGDGQLLPGEEPVGGGSESALRRDPFWPVGYAPAAGGAALAEDGVDPAAIRWPRK